MTATNFYPFVLLLLWTQVACLQNPATSFQQIPETGTVQQINDTYNLAVSKLSTAKQAYEYDTVINILKQVSNLAKQTGYDKYYILSKRTTGKAYFIQKEYSKALFFFKEALKKSQLIQDSLETALCSNNISIIYINHLNNPKEALPYLETVLKYKRLLIRNNYPGLLNFAYLQMGNYYRNTMQYDKSNTYYTEAIALSKEIKMEYHAFYIMQLYNFTDMNQFTPGVNMAVELIKRARADGDLITEAWTWQTLSSLYSQFSLKTQMQEAQINALIAAQKSHDTGLAHLFRTIIKWNNLMNSETPLSKSVLKSIETDYDSCLIYRPWDFILTDLGYHFCIAGDMGKAHRFYNERIKRAMQINDDHHLAESYIYKAILSARSGQYDESAYWAAKARNIKGQAAAPYSLNRLSFIESLILAHKGNATNAVILLEKGIGYLDSVNTLKSEGIARLAKSLEQYKFQQDSLILANKTLQMEQEKDRIGRIMLTTCILLLLGLSIIFIRWRNSYHQLNTLVQNVTTQLEGIQNQLYSSRVLNYLNPEDAEKEDHQISLLNKQWQGIGSKKIYQRFREIDNLVKLQMDFNQKIQQKVAKKEEELRFFNYAVGHDLKGPLDNLYNLLELINLKSTDPTEVKKLITIAQNVAVEGKIMLDALNRFTIADQSSLEPKPIDLRDLTQQVVAQFNTKVYVHIKNDATFVFVDPYLVKQVFYNIISNAIKFTRFNSSPHIAILTNTVEEGMITITIEDNGVGFSLEKMPNLFRLFGTAHDRAVFEGSGIGLVISKRIIERHGGSITIVSEEGQGTTVTFTLPQYKVYTRI